MLQACYVDDFTQFCGLTGVKGLNFFFFIEGGGGHLN